MKALVSSLTVLFSATSIPAYAMGLNIFADGHYSVLTPKSDSSSTTSSDDFKGAGGGITLQYNLINAKVADVFVGVGFDYTKYKLEEGTTAKYDWTRTSIPLEAGVALNALPMFSIQLSGFYEYVLSSKMDIKFIDATLGEFSFSVDPKNDKTYGAKIRLMMTSVPKLRFGIMGQYMMGSFEMKDDEIGLDSKTDTKGYSVGAIVGVSL